MAVDADRAERWRAKAEQYRVCAAACIEPGARAAYLALAESCEDVVEFFARRGFSALVAASPPLKGGTEQGCRG